MATICVFGDSIAWGAVDPENGGWVSSLRNYFESKSLRADLDTDVYNLGISGDNTDDLLERFDVEVEARKPDTIVFAIGINDAQFLIPQQRNRVPIDSFKQNMITLIGKSKNSAKRTVLVGLTKVDEKKTTPIPWNLDKEYRNEHIQQYDSCLREISSTHSIDYIDLSRILANEDLADGLHPNTAGHKKIYEVVKTILG